MASYVADLVDAVRVVFAVRTSPPPPGSAAVVGPACRRRHRLRRDRCRGDERRLMGALTSSGRWSIAFIDGHARRSRCPGATTDSWGRRRRRTLGQSSSTAASWLRRGDERRIVEALPEPRCRRRLDAHDAADLLQAGAGQETTVAWAASPTRPQRPLPLGQIIPHLVDRV